MHSAPKMPVTPSRSHSVEMLDRVHIDNEVRHSVPTRRSEHVSRSCHTHGGENEASGTSKKRERAPPINSARLRSIRQRTRNAVVNVLEDGWVCLEFTKAHGGSGDSSERVVEVFRVSPDGRHIEVYQPEGARGGTLRDCPPSPPDSQTIVKQFNYNDLPRKYWKKYEYASRFVNLVRSKTPKVTMYTRRAKCMLMENSPTADFEVIFYDGAKFSQTADCTRIIECDGTSLTLESTSGIQHLAPETRELWEYVHECHTRCLDLEALLKSVDRDESKKDISYFPITIGRRPLSTSNTQSCTLVAPTSTSTPDPNLVEIGCNGSSRRAAGMRSFDGTVLSHGTKTASAVMPKSEALTDSRSSKRCITNPAGRARSVSRTSAASPVDSVCSSEARHAGGRTTRGQASPVAPPSVLCRVFVPGIGWGSQLSNGEVQVHFTDGSELGIQAHPMLVKYTDPQGTFSRFRESDQLPGNVRQKLEALPAVMLKLEASQASGKGQ
ncbi:Serine/threonine-protein kinase PLK4 [Lamellibrachia satsuma]|nr:Serine/threonine-protein kinase PLK4 [Lamellibrachia satsuma]